MKWLRRFFRFFASLKFAVLILATLAALGAVGTFVESTYDAWTAKNLVYHSVWMYGALGALVLSLAAVVVDRWPWRARHIPFLLAHAGIIIMIYGALLTLLYGVDGSIRLEASGAAVEQVTVGETEINVYRSRTGDDYEKVFAEEVNFLKSPVRPGKPFLIKAKDLRVELLESIPYGVAKEQIEESKDPLNGPALRFQLSNANVSEIDWLLQRTVFTRAEKQIGPVLITMGGLWTRTPEINEIRLFQDESKKLRFALYSRDKVAADREGFIEEGKVIATPWMGLELKVLRYFERAMQKYSVEASERPTPKTVPSVRVRYNGIEGFLLLNNYIKVFTDEWVYLVSYQNKRVPLGFEMSLRRFHRTNYPGSFRAMEYESEVDYDDQTPVRISMNEPLKYKGYYIYQAGFDEPPNGGRATASILSVNRDPGRAWKYIGTTLMCLGVISLFYRRARGAKSPATGSAVMQG
ncbi:MAG: cytochrome c biogenesis protein ResB [Bdellovibrionaceae bacterium]|nr:cytochrome c biogenesis protein ResB [Pseudobdellovibrionaceae bacterium]